MRERTRLDDEPGRAHSARPALDAPEPVASTAAVFDAAGRIGEPGRGGAPAVGRAIDSLHASAGNAAISRLLGGATSSHHRERSPRVSAGRAATTDRPVVQASPDDDEETAGTDETAAAAAPVADAGTTATDPPPTTDAAVTGADPAPTELAGGAPAGGLSWTKVGPPSNTTYSVSGSLRDVANAVAARTEAGSVTATPSQDTDTWTPDGGSAQVIGARVTVAQVLELPTWTDRSKATKNQQAEWDRFHAAISTHEAGHVSTDKAAFAGVHSKMIGKSSKDADSALDTAEAKAKTDNETYDTNNKHGLTQGTGINANIDEVTKVP